MSLEIEITPCSSVKKKILSFTEVIKYIYLTLVLGK